VTRTRILPKKQHLEDIVLTLLACEILVPRIDLGSGLLTLDDVIPLFAGALGVVWVLRSGRFPRRIVVFLLLIWSIIGFLTASRNTASAQEFVGSFAKGAMRPLNSLFILVLVYGLTRQRPYRVTHTIDWIVRVGTVEGAFAVIAYTLGWVLNRPIPGLKPIPPSSAVSSLVPGRFVGTTNTASNFVGAYFLMVIPLTLAVALTTEKGSARRRYRVAIVLQLFGLVVTFTRASFLALVLVLLCMLVLLRKKRLLRTYLAIGSIFGLIIVWAAPQYILRFTVDRTGRLGRWAAGLRMMIDHPILGVGFNRFMPVALMNQERYPTTYNPHNAYIMLGAEGGIGMLLVGIGLAVFYLLDLHRAFRRNTSPRGRVLLAGLLAGAAGFLLQNLTNDLLYLPHLTTYFWLYYALGMNMPGTRPFPVPLRARDISDVSSQAYARSSNWPDCDE